MKPMSNNIFQEIFENPLDPMEAARRHAGRTLRARFYKEATVAENDGGFQILLDGRAVRTPARHLLAAPVRSLAQALADEWSQQGEFVDPTRMPLTRLANSIIDGVAAAPGPVRDEIAKYLGTDLLFYRADGPEGLVASQARHWDPIVEWARTALGARFMLAEGVMHVRQSEDAIAAAMRAVPAADPGDTRALWQLGALSVITTLTGSALIAIAFAAGRLNVEQAWAAAHVDEDWNMDFWGRDTQAIERRTFRFAEMQAAALVLDALR